MMYDSIIRTVVRNSLGPHGRLLADFYLEHQLIINGLVIAFVMIKKVFFESKKKKEDNSKPASEENLNCC